MSRKFISAACAAALLFASPLATTVQAAPAPAPAMGSVAPATDNDPATYARKLELAKRYMKAARMDEVFGASMKAMGGSLADQMEKEFPGMPKGFNQAVMDAMGETYVSMMQDMTERMIPIIAKIYTEEELTKITEFMESPVGQSMIAKSPQLSAALATSLPEIMGNFQTEFQTRLCRKIDCNDPAMKGFKPQAS